MMVESAPSPKIALPAPMTTIFGGLFFMSLAITSFSISFLDHQAANAI